jgi:hypothetical protein
MLNPSSVKTLTNDSNPNYKTYFSNTTQKFVTLPKAGTMVNTPNIPGRPLPTNQWNTMYSKDSCNVSNLQKFTPTTSLTKPLNISLEPNDNEYLVLIDEIDVIKETTDTDLDLDLDLDSNNKTDYIPKIYFGSLTVLGLYILFRLIHKR